jgi:hypothetical protein
MSDLGTEPTPASYKDAKAQAKAAKAYTKASRPWFKKKRFIVPLAIVVLAIIATVNGGGSEDAPAAATTADTSSEDTTSNATEDSAQDPSGSVDSAATEASAGLGDKVRDGKFQFTVKKVDCGKTRIGSAAFDTKAQGQFCLVSLKIKNIGNEAQSMFADNQYLFDEKGRKSSADIDAAMYMGDRAQTLWEEINPGNVLKGIVVFDIPRNAEPTSLELHDSMFSGGVTVSLK